MINNDNTLYPFGPLYPSEENEVKLNHDRYEVYVNGDFLGYKMLFGYNEDVQDIDDFIKEQGIHHFHAKVDGDHYLIESEEDEELKGILSVYLESH